ncbi:hypothetical protein ES703_87483 [subsurface metagenome]
MNAGGENNGPTTHERQRTGTDHWRTTPAFPAVTGDSGITGQATRREGGDKRPAGPIARAPDPDRGHPPVAGEAQGGEVLGEDNAHVQVPGRSVPRERPDAHQTGNPVVPRRQAQRGVPRPGQQRAEGARQPVRLPARRGAVALEPDERGWPREGEVPREAVPRRRGRHQGPERQVHEAQGHR